MTECNDKIFIVVGKMWGNIRHKKSVTISFIDNYAFLQAVWTRLELATSGVTGRHSNQLNYQTVVFIWYANI